MISWRFTTEAPEKVTEMRGFVTTYSQKSAPPVRSCSCTLQSDRVRGIQAHWRDRSHFRPSTPWPYVFRPHTRIEFDEVR